MTQVQEIRVRVCLGFCSHKFSSINIRKSGAETPGAPWELIDQGVWAARIRKGKFHLPMIDSLEVAVRQRKFPLGSSCFSLVERMKADDTYSGGWLAWSCWVWRASTSFFNQSMFGLPVCLLLPMYSLGLWAFFYSVTHPETSLLHLPCQNSVCSGS